MPGESTAAVTGFRLILLSARKLIRALSFGDKILLKQCRLLPMSSVTRGNRVVASQQNQTTYRIMNIANCSCAPRPEPSEHENRVAGGFRHHMKDFKSLDRALQSGDAAASEAALTTLQSDLQGAQKKHKASPLLDEATQVGKDFKALQAAVQSGDLGVAQEALATLRTDMRVARHAQGRWHHHGMEASGTPAIASPIPPTGTPEISPPVISPEPGTSVSVTETIPTTAPAEPISILKFLETKPTLNVIA